MVIQNNTLIALLFGCFMKPVTIVIKAVKYKVIGIIDKYEYFEGDIKYDDE